MKISIITACFNSAATLLDTLESVRSQSYPDYELIVIDGGSTDGTVAMLADYEKHFGGRMKWISEKDGGIYYAMNKGIAMATGDVIGFLNSDDYYFDNEVLQDIANAFGSHPATDAIHGDLLFINANRKVVRRWKGKEYAPGAFQRGWMPAHPTFYCRRSCYEQFGVFAPEIGSAADFEIMLRYIEKHRISTTYIPRNFIYMRTGGSSTSGIRAILRNTKQNILAFNLNNIDYPWHYGVSRFLPKVANILQVLKARKSD